MLWKVHWRYKSTYHWKTNITSTLIWDVICVNFKKSMIYKLIELHNGYGYVLSPQFLIANGDDYITSNLLGIDVNSKFGKKKDVQTGSSYPSRAHEFTSVYFGGVWVVYIVIFLWYFSLLCLSLFCVLCPMLPVSLDCPFLIVPSVHSNVYLAICVLNATF